MSQSPEVMAMAREICSAHYRKRARDPRNSYGHEIAHADRIDAGESDDWDCVQTTADAIVQTSELAANFNQKWLASAKSAAQPIRDFSHLTKKGADDGQAHS